MHGYVIKVDNHPSIGIHDSYLCPHILPDKTTATDFMQNYARELMIDDSSFKPHKPIEDCADFIELENGDEDLIFISVEKLTILEPYKGE